MRTERFGVRKLEVRGRDIYLNGRPFLWRGVGFHEIEPINGLHPADRAFYRDRIWSATDWRLTSRFRSPSPS